MSEVDERRSRLTRFPTRLKRRRGSLGPAGASADSVAPPAREGGASDDPAERTESPRPGRTTGEDRPPTTGHAAPLFAKAAEERRLRNRRMYWIGRALSLLSWGLVATVPLGALVIELSLTSTCQVPQGLSEGRMRFVWHQVWLISALVTVIPLCYIAWHAPSRLLGLATLGSFALWKGLALARDRIVLPVCPDGWPPGAPRDPMDLPLTLATAGAFAVFVFLTGLAAVLRRRPGWASDG